MLSAVLNCLLPLILTFPSVAFQGLSFEHVIVDADGPLDVWLKAVGDLNRDGKPDLIAGGWTKGGLVWYENPSWRKHVISAEGAFSTDGEVIDMDRDGDLDIVAISKNQILWFEAPDWKPHLVAEVEAHDIEAADLDGDRRPDIVARNQGAFRPQGGTTIHMFRWLPSGEWKSRTIAIPDGEGLLLADLDRDKDLDVVLERQWLENPGKILDRDWPSHPYGASWDYPHTYIAAGDLNGDRRPDVILSPAEKAGSTYRISWLEGPADPRRAEWREHVVDGNIETVHHFVGVADFDGDRQIDIVTARMHQGKSPEIGLYRNTGKGRGWQKHIVAPVSSHSMKIVDINGDGRPDLYGANWRGHTVDLWINRKPGDSPRVSRFPRSRPTRAIALP